MNYKASLTNKIFEIISKASQELNVDSYVIGGFVRDLILKREFKKDIDIVAVGSGIELALKVSELLPNKPKVQVFKTYGTAMLRFEDTEIEFVGARKESYNLESRNPVVENGTLQDDQNRRDFTINALAISLNKNNYGELLDPFDGVIDLENKIIKTPLDPDITYSDDPLRMLRRRAGARSRRPRRRATSLREPSCPEHSSAARPGPCESRSPAFAGSPSTP